MYYLFSSVLVNESDMQQWQFMSLLIAMSYVALVTRLRAKWGWFCQVLNAKPELALAQMDAETKQMSIAAECGAFKFPNCDLLSKRSVFCSQFARIEVKKNPKCPLLLSRNTLREKRRLSPTINALKLRDIVSDSDLCNTMLLPFVPRGEIRWHWKSYQILGDMLSYQ